MERLGDIIPFCITNRGETEHLRLNQLGPWVFWGGACVICDGKTQTLLNQVLEKNTKHLGNLFGLLYVMDFKASFYIFFLAFRSTQSF